MTNNPSPAATSKHEPPPHTDGVKTTMEAHAFALIFPMMSGAEIEALAADISEHGQREAIIAHDGKVLDGRNRCKACEIAGVVPRIQEYQGDDPLGFVVSSNLHRRHLTVSQRSLVASKLATLGKGKPVNGGNQPFTQKVAAKALAVSRDSVKKGKRLMANAVPALIAAVDNGSVSLATATTVSTLPVADQIEALELEPCELKRRVAEIRHANQPSLRPSSSESQPSEIRSDAKACAFQIRKILDKIPDDAQCLKGVLQQVIDYCKVRLDEVKKKGGPTL